MRSRQVAQRVAVLGEDDDLAWHARAVARQLVAPRGSNAARSTCESVSGRRPRRPSSTRSSRTRISMSSSARVRAALAASTSVSSTSPRAPGPRPVPASRRDRRARESGRPPARARRSALLELASSSRNRWQPCPATFEAAQDRLGAGRETSLENGQGEADGVRPPPVPSRLQPLGSVHLVADVVAHRLVEVAPRVRTARSSRWRRGARETVACPPW